MCSVAFPESPNHFIVPKGYFFKPYVFILEVFIGCQAFFYVEIEIPSDFFLTLFINRVGHTAKQSLYRTASHTDRCPLL